MANKPYDWLWMENIIQRYVNYNWLNHKIWLKLHFGPYVSLLGQIGTNLVKITQPKSQNENLIFLGQNISLQGKHTKTLEF